MADDALISPMILFFDTCAKAEGPPWATLPSTSNCKLNADAQPPAHTNIYDDPVLGQLLLDEDDLLDAAHHKVAARV